MRKKNSFKRIISMMLILLAINYFVNLMSHDYAEGKSGGISDIPSQEEFNQGSDSLAYLLLNTFFPSAKATYENYYGEDLPGFVGGYFKKEVFNMENLLGLILPSYKSYTETADLAGYVGPISISDLPQDLDSEVATEDEAFGEQKEILSFEDVPEGAIYFDEDDTYNPEDSLNPLLIPSGTIVEQGKVVDDPISVELAKKHPTVLIYHTHATESYMPYDSQNYHSQIEKNSVVNVGTIMTNIIQSKYKYRVIHDKTLHDQLSYSVSYSNSLKAIKSHVSKNKNLKVLIDVHRDAFGVANQEQKKASKKLYTAMIKGKPAAKVMLVVGTQNPNFKELEKFAVCIKNKMNKMYPGLLLKVNTPHKKYNQYNSNYSILIEVGCMLNTTEEAAYSAELMGNVLGEVMKDIQK